MSKLCVCLVSFLVLILFNQSFAIQVKNGTPREGGGAIKTWFPRMVDKAQLSYEKKLDKLRLAYPCPNDKQVLSYMGITAEAFKEIVVHSKTDAEILSKLKETGAKLPR